MPDIPVSADDPRAVARQLADYRRSAMLFSSSSPRMIDQHEDKWVAVLSGEIVAEADEFEALYTMIVELDFPREHVLVRHVERNHRTLIL